MSEGNTKTYRRLTTEQLGDKLDAARACGVVLRATVEPETYMLHPFWRLTLAFGNFDRTPPDQEGKS